MYSVIGIGIAAGLVVIGVIAIAVSGVRSLKNGKQDLKKVVTFVIPFVVFGIAYAISGSPNDAGIATMLFMMAAMALLIVLTGFRSTFNL